MNRILDELPTGYRELLLAPGQMLLLPDAVIEDFRAELRARDDAREDERRAAQRLLQEERMQLAKEAREQLAADEKTQADVRTPASRYPDKPEVGLYRVLPGLQAMADAEGDRDIGLGTFDGDYRERKSTIRRKLIEKGPDRLVASPVAWRSALDELDIALPNFRGPVQLLRHAFALAEATMVPVRVPPMLLLGPPGVGKTYFTHRVADMLQTPYGAIAFDQPSAGAQLRGTEKYWANSETGLLFNLICLGDYANPVVLLDEIDKAQMGSGRRELDPLAQLHGALEPETARRTIDVSADIQFDASLVTYVATANTLNGLTLPILSRMEVFDIQPSRPSEAVEVARTVVRQVLERYGLTGKVQFDPKGFYVLAHMTPRFMNRTVEKLVAAAVASRQTRVTEADLWAVLEPDAPRLH